jgi:deoxyguanosine kinase
VAGLHGPGGGHVRRFIVVEGLIGAGKTTLCRLITDEWHGRLVLEPSEDNPFLESFYVDPARFAFPVQMFYLVNRWRQQDQIRQQELFESVVVSDYLFEKDRLFAEKTLQPLELELYDRFAAALGERAPAPDLVVWLDAPTAVLLERIARRAIPGEDRITAAYLDDLRDRYERLWAGYTAAPVLRVDNRDMNYADEPLGRRRVLDLIRNALEGRRPSGAFGSTGASSSGIGPGGTPGSGEPDREVQPALFGAGGS